MSLPAEREDSAEGSKSWCCNTDGNRAHSKPYKIVHFVMSEAASSFYVWTVTCRLYPCSKVVEEKLLICVPFLRFKVKVAWHDIFVLNGMRLVTWKWQVAEQNVPDLDFLTKKSWQPVVIDRSGFCDVTISDCHSLGSRFLRLILRKDYPT